ncbi:hypothetical protein F2Q70_00021658 [Brassica cretica]|uniref:Uncharacterized protein n=1 Tax=Brassica cretica TaxID=69181 RepID=A0A8S9GWR6_BRACR|nr:hypothetical protein F2Q70_00021658 [Brassica cretica]
MNTLPSTSTGKSMKNNHLKNTSSAEITLPSIDASVSTSIDTTLNPNLSISKLNDNAHIDYGFLTPDEFGIFRDPDGYARAIDGRILQVSREDIADILQVANGPDNLFSQQRGTPDVIQTDPNNHVGVATTEINPDLSRQQKGQASIDGTTETSIDRVTPTLIDRDDPTSIDRRYEFGNRAFDMYGARKFTWERRDEYGVYRDGCGHARGVAGEMIPVTKDDIRKLLERTSLFEESHICLPEHATSFTLTRLHQNSTPKMKSMRWCLVFVELRKDWERSSNHCHDLIIDRRTTCTIDRRQSSYSKIPAKPQCSAQHKDEWEVSYIDTRINDVYYPLNNNVDWLSTKIDLLQQDLDTIRKKDQQPATSIDVCTFTLLDAKVSAMNERLRTYEDMHDRFISPVIIDLNKLSSQLLHAQKDIENITNQKFLQANSASIDRLRGPWIEGKNPVELLPYTAAEVNKITSKIYTTIDNMEERLDKRCDDVYFPFDNKISGIDSHTEWLQKEVKAVQRQLAAQHQISASIDRMRAKSLDGKSRRSTDAHIIASIDAESTPAGEQLIHKTIGSMHKELTELSAYAYDNIGWHQFSIDNIQDRLQNISNVLEKMDDKWKRNDEATRSFIASWSRITILDLLIADSTIDAKADQPINYTLALKRMKQPKLISNTKPDITACLGAWYTWDRILQTSLEDNDEDRWTDYSSHRSTSSAESTDCNAVLILTHEEFAAKHPHPPSPFYDKIDRSVEPTIDRQSESGIDRHNTPPIDRRAPLTYRVRLPSIDNDYINALRPPPIPLAKTPEPKPNPLNSSPEPSTVTDDLNNTSLDVKHQVDNFAPPNHCYQHFAFQPPRKRGHDDYSIGSWADSGFHESYAVDTVITSSNEEHTEEYDEDYWKERAIEMSLQDERLETHKLTNKFPTSIDSVHSTSVDTHPRPAKQPLTSIDTHTGTSIDIRAAAKIQEQENISPPTRDPDGNARAMDGRILQVSREDIAYILQVANGPDNLFSQQHGTPDVIQTDPNNHVGVATTEFNPDLSRQPKGDDPTSIDRRYKFGNRAFDMYGARKFTWEQRDEYVVFIDECGHAQGVAGEMIPVTKDDIRKLLERASLFEESHICICGAQEKLGEELKSLQLEKEATTSTTIDAPHAPSINVSLPTAQIPAQPQCSAQHKDEWEVSYIDTRINDVYYPLNNNVDWLSTKIELLQQDLDTIRKKDQQPATSIDMCTFTSLDAKVSAMNERLRTYKDMRDRFISPAKSTSIDRLRGPWFDGKKSVELLPYTAAEWTRQPRRMATERSQSHSEATRSSTPDISIDRQDMSKIDRWQLAKIGNQQQIASIDAESTPIGEQLIHETIESMRKELTELSAYAYDNIGWHQVSVDNVQERLQNISNVLEKMDDKWTRNDEVIRSFIASWS